MPTVAIIDGIKIEMFYRDHPPPHIHASIAEHELLLCIDDGSIYEGKLPARYQRKVVDYVRQSENKEKLKRLWQDYNSLS